MSALMQTRLVVEGVEYVKASDYDEMRELVQKEIKKLEHKLWRNGFCPYCENGEIKFFNNGYSHCDTCVSAKGIKQ